MATSRDTVRGQAHLLQVAKLMRIAIRLVLCVSILPTVPQTVADGKSEPTITLQDITQNAGIHFVHNSGAFGGKYLPETMGPGVAFIDCDNDGWPDIFLVNGMDWPGHRTKRSTPKLYHNNHDGTFTDITKEAGLAVEMYGMGVAVGTTTMTVMTTSS